MVYLQSILLVVLGFFLSGCKPSSPEKSAGGGVDVPQHGFMLTQSGFNGLSPDDQFVVANKALSTMFQGLPMDEFFDLTQGLDDPQVQYPDFINATQAKLLTPLTSAQLKLAGELTFGREDNVATADVDESIPAAFVASENAVFAASEVNDFPHQVTMSKIQGYPLSKNQFVHWMSYFLANTIMFSPAREMDSTDEQDIGRVLAYLELNLGADRPIRDVIKGWLNNLSRWRVSRSPENHALEMFELYLGIFNDTLEEQANTINGGKACSAWYLTDNGEQYQLKKDPYIDEGVESVKVFDNLISSCAELYDLVAGHPLVIPRVTEVIVNYFLEGTAADEKQALIQSIVNTGPVTFQDIFLPIIFSKEFLLNSTRPKTIEENTFGFLNTMHWNSRATTGDLGPSMLYRLLVSDRSFDLGVHRMGWSSMESKIGRTPFVPMDALSFATYHKGIRESVLMDQRAFDGLDFPEESDFVDSIAPYPITNGAFYVAGTQNLKPELDGISVNEFIDFVFLSALGRRATAEEVEAFRVEGSTRVYLREYDGVLELERSDEAGEFWEKDADNFAEIMLDYISRLPEFYYYRSVSN